jgi:hypothetical protein
MDAKHATRLIGLLWVLLLTAALVVGCSAISDEEQLVGRWTTQLNGYNATTNAATKYEQTAVFTDDAKVTLQIELGGMSPVKGTWEIVKGTDNGKVLRITWDNGPAEATNVNEFTYQFKGNQLYLSRVKGGMPKPENLNVTEQDPVVYERGPLPQ